MRGARRSASSSVNEFERNLDAVVERLGQVLGTDLVGVYLHGSLVLGDFSPERSDVDAVAVAARSLSREEKRELGELLSQRSLPCPASGLEFHLLRVDALVPVEKPRFELHVSTSTEGEPERVVDGEGHPGDPDLVMHLAVLHEHGRPLLGPPPAELFPAVSRPLLLKAFIGELTWARAHASPSYLVLNACRAWRYAEEDVVGSKTEGAEWARARVADPTPIEPALRHRRGVAHDHPDPEAASALAAEVEARLRDAVRASSASTT